MYAFAIMNILIWMYNSIDIIIMQYIGFNISRQEIIAYSIAQIYCVNQTKSISLLTPLLQSQPAKSMLPSSEGILEETIPRG